MMPRSDDPSAVRALEPSADTARAWLDEMSRFVVDHLTESQHAPAMGDVSERAHLEAKERSPAIGEQPLAGGIKQVVELLQRGTELSLNTTGPGYLAYIPGGGLFPAALADLAANVMNRFTGIAGAAPLLVRLESDTLSWLCRNFGYESGSQGLFTSGGSSANLSAFIAARFDHFGDSGDFRRATVYTSSEAHHSVSKGLRLAGIPASNVRAIAVDERLRLRADELERVIERDRAEGAHPFLVVSAAGSTNTGAVDPLTAINQLRDRYGLWHHVDGAYGGAFALCDEGRTRLRGISQADSITFDPHKGMFLPYGTGCLLVREADKLAAVHQSDAVYLTAFDEDDSARATSPTDFSAELSRPYRGLRVWLALMLHGAKAFRDALDEKLRLAETFHQMLKQSDWPIEIIDPPQLSVVPFRLQRREGETTASVNERNQRWMSDVNDKRRVHLSGTYLPDGDGESLFTLRVCVLSYRTHAHTIDACFEDLAEALERPTRH